MDFIKTISGSIQSFMENIKARITSPFSGAFMTIWLLCNWRLVYFFTQSDKDVASKINHININYMDIDVLFWIPLWLTIGYLVAFPALSNIASLIFSVVDNWTGLFKAKFIEKAVFLTKNQKAALYKEMKRQAEAHKEQVDSLNEAMNAMNSLLVSDDIGAANDDVIVNNDATTDNANDTFSQKGDGVVKDDARDNFLKLTGEAAKGDDNDDGKGYHAKRLEVLAKGINPQLSAELISEEMKGNAFLKRMLDDIDKVKAMGSFNADGLVRHLQLDEPVHEGQRAFAEAVFAIIWVLRSRAPRPLNLEDMTELAYGYIGIHVNEHEIKDFMGLPIALGLVCIERKNEYALTIDGVNLAKAGMKKTSQPK